MDTAPIPRWMIQAFQELQAGVKQGDPRILDYFRAVNYPDPSSETASCAAFVNFCLAAGGIKGNGSAAAIDMLRWGLNTPAKFGAVAIFRWPTGLDKGGNHTAFFVEMDVLRPGWGIFLGSNQDHQVCLMGYPVADLLGLRWPEQAVASSQ